MSKFILVISPTEGCNWKEEEKKEKEEEEEEEKEEEEEEDGNIMSIGKLSQKSHVHVLPEDFKFSSSSVKNLKSHVLPEDEEKRKLREKVTITFDKIKMCDICYEDFPEENTIRVNCHNRTTNTRRSTRPGEKILCETCQTILQVQKTPCPWCLSHKIKWCTRKRTKKGDLKLRQKKIDLIKNIFYYWNEKLLKKYLKHKQKKLSMNGDITDLQTRAIKYIRSKKIVRKSKK